MLPPLSGAHQTHTHYHTSHTQNIHTHIQTRTQGVGTQSHPGLTQTYQTVHTQRGVRCAPPPFAVAATRTDGSVEWANSLGRCLEPGCRLGHIAEFGNLEAFGAAYVAAHRPINGVAQVCMLCVWRAAVAVLTNSVAVHAHHHTP
jgi:hypothetical protein